MLNKIQIVVTSQIIVALMFALFVVTNKKSLPYVRNLDFPPDFSNGDRLTFAFRCLVFSALPLLASVGVIGYLRFWSPNTLAANPVAPVAQSQQLYHVSQRVLQNTLEQTALHVLAILALASSLDPDQLDVIPVLVLLFVFGRALFMLGYMYHPLYRGVGFALTFHPIVASLVYAIYTISSKS